MKGRIIDLIGSDALVALEDGTTMEINRLTLSGHLKLGDMVNVDPSPLHPGNDKLVDFF
ncbi:hypothetical protein [Clostridium peptidivorans]|uniref:hypothetical protein n=1 Tax=Clostridium peptidivorans TaxID=100174 RepID=UPI0015CD5AF2|nr:hypothetical protein [Clostridium peptidivorans]